jgi:mxaJ protein
MGRKLGMLTAVLFLVISSLLVWPAQAGHIKELRVCGDPDNLPFSNKQLEGFENKIAEVIAKELGVPLSYYWWPHQRGLIRRTLKAGQCDAMISIPEGWDPVLWTKPYYRSAYVMVYPRNRGFQIKSLDDPILRKLRIGVYVNTPPEEALAERDLSKNVVRYNLFYDYQNERPGKIIQDLVAGDIDVAIEWGPMAGFYVKKLDATNLEMVPLLDGGKGTPFTYEFSMGVKQGDKVLKTELEQAISKHRADIQKILEDYGVPLLALQPKEQFGPVEEKPGQIIFHRLD